MTGVRITGEQRVFSLVLALVVSPNGATKRDLLSSVYGYSDRYRAGEVSEPLERQFERDKDQLRKLGIPLETIDSPGEPGNTQLARYRISKERLQIPEDLRFTAQELMLLRLAALVWSEGSLNAQSRRAAFKLEALGASVNAQHLGVAPRIFAPEAQALPLQQAADELREVKFRYRLPSRETALERHVAPLRLHRADGRWHLIAWDLERAATRVFLLSRIEGEVRVMQARYDPALRESVTATIENLLSRENEQRATVRVRRGTVAESRLLPRVAEGAHRPLQSGEWREVLVGTLDYREHALAQELVGYGSDVEAVEPSELREAVAADLATVIAQHTNGNARAQDG